MKLHDAAAFCLAACCFFMGVAPAPMNVFLALALVLTVLSASGRQAVFANFTNPAVMSFSALFCIMLLGSFHGEGAWAESQYYLGKYNELLLAPLIAAAITTDRQAARLQSAFGCAMLLTLVLSYAIWLQWLPLSVVKALNFGDASNPTVFKLHITQSIFMVFAACLWGARARAAFQSVAPRERPIGWVWVTVTALAIFNVLFMVQGRTGYVVLAMVAFLLFFRRFGKRGLALAVALLLSVAVGGYGLSSSFKTGIDEISVNARSWSPEKSDHASSTAQRLGYWVGAIAIITEHPLTGTGLGGYQSAFRKANKVKTFTDNNNPHQQYLLMWAQLGVLGLGAFVALQVVLWRQAAGRIGRHSGARSDSLRTWAMVIIAGFAGANFFNSLHLDSAEGLFYVVMLCAALGARRSHV